MERGCCCCWTLETCVKVQGFVVGLVSVLNIGRVMYKTAFPEEFDSECKHTAAGIYLDGLDFLINGLGGTFLAIACLFLLRGLREKRPSLMQPYLVVSTCLVGCLAAYAIVYGVAVIQALPDEEHVRGYLSAGEVVALVVAVLLLLIAFPTYFLLNVSSLMDYMSSDGYQMQFFYYIGNISAA
ncbi:uncharacterized protein LOC117641423 [Thrips palmi]|uniref:Uncharacterized protein LOC117641423 n=1 Tax=Thrips palmi TaxID=161013 RepID=A0A6P8YKV6_THRPL|nr:uncharacterized protein LOC117641423 [Thrips palmi]XP_034234612.1 uncharacterized protein LOC117641423 [Thrips palmi]